MQHRYEVEPLAAGSIVGGAYRVLRPLTAAATGILHEVEELATGARRALELVRVATTDPDLVAAWTHETGLLAHVPSDRIARPFDAGRDDDTGRLYLVTEALEGSIVERVVSHSGAFPWAGAVSVLEEVGHALAAAHAHGVQHRGLEPANVFLRRGSHGRAPFTVKVLEFGVAKALATACDPGSPSWMAPEQLTPGAEVGAPADIWAFGLLSFVVLTGRHFFASAGHLAPHASSVVREVLVDPLLPASKRANRLGVGDRLPPRFDDWFARCVHRDPAQRFPDVAFALRELGAMERPVAGAEHRKERVSPVRAPPLPRDDGPKAGSVQAWPEEEPSEPTPRTSRGLGEPPPPVSRAGGEPAPRTVPYAPAEVSSQSSYAAGELDARTSHAPDESPRTARTPGIAGVTADSDAPAALGPAARARSEGPSMWAGAATVAVAAIVGAAVALLAILVARAQKDGASAAATAVVTPGTAGNEGALRLHGSNTIGAELAPALAEAFLRRRTGASTVVRRRTGPDELVVEARSGTKVIDSVEIAAHGSATAFEDLAAGSTDIGMASRRIHPDEAKKLAPLGDLTSAATEHVIALDGIAVIVNPLNPVSQLTKRQIADIFSGKLRRWSEVYWKADPIVVHARDDRSGTYDTFRQLVLDGRPLVQDARRHEASDELSDAVAADPDAIGFIGLPYVRSAKPVMVQEEGSVPLLPSPLTVSTEDYPLTRRLYLYAPLSAPAAARDFIDFAQSDEGQRVAQEVGFVDLRPECDPNASRCTSCSREYAEAV
ncbi:MAG: substrate-binding domain-containing protein, partial [Myxococcales bacterium]|nr:substrate-binding domain-containing protein [Myxococcales bacterium]